MPRQRKALTPERAFELFSERLESAETRPNINRWQPMPQQEIFLQSQKKYRILFGGNRAGKTASSTADDVMVLCHRHPYRQHLYPEGPIRMRAIGSDFTRGVDQTLVPYFAQYIPPSKLINGAWEDSYRQGDRFLTLADGSTCSFMSYEQDPKVFQSVSLHHVHFDEEPPESIFRESRLRILDTGGTWTMSETPVQQLEWVQDELIEPWEADKEASTLDVIYIRTLDNIHLPAAEVQELVSEMAEEERIIRLEGKYPPGKGLVFPEFSRNFPNVISHQLFLQQFRLDPRAWTFYESMDYGMTNPTAWIWTAVHTDGSIVSFHVRYAARVDVENWSIVVKLTRRNLAAQLGIPESQFMTQLRGTFGDPAIGKGASGETGNTIQQAYALNGIYIGTEGIYEARAGNQNFGLNQMHKYLKTRPLAAGIPASTGLDIAQPWWQITDAGETDDHAQNTALIDELKKARTPRQTAKQQEVKNQSEQIRDKDNHAIDGTKYLFMVTHELRPPQFVDEPSDFVQQFQQTFGQAAQAPTAVHDDFDARLGQATPWDTYSSLEN